MPVIRVDTSSTTTTPPPNVRLSLLEKLKNEFVNPSTEGGPVIFEIPVGSTCIDVLVVWQEWADVRSEDRSRLILDAYGEKQQQQIAQALGVTFEEAMQQQLLPYVVVSTLEREPTFALLLCSKDENKVAKLMDEIRDAKRVNGGIFLPDGRIELRFPTRAMADSIYARLFADEKYRNFYWQVIPEAAASN
jgi:hypothetical protein